MKNSITQSILLLSSLLLINNNAEAASIILKSGITITGQLIERTEEDVTIKDSDTQQLKVIKTVFIRNMVLDPKEQKIKEKKKKGKDLMLRGGDSDESGIINVIQPSLGILPGIAYPFGKVGTKLNLGYGGLLFFDVGIPKMPDIFKMRFGLTAGFLYHATKGAQSASQLFIIPIIAYTKLQFITAVGVRPYIKLGGGITPIFGGGSSYDPTFAAAFGIGFVHRKVLYMEFFIEGGIMMVFEKVRGDFVTAHIGFAYRFGAPPAEISTIATDMKKQ